METTENEEISDGVLVRLQSQQMLDQLHGDEPLETSTTGAVDGDKDSSGSEDDPCESMQTQNDDDDQFETRLRLLVLEKKAKMDVPAMSQYDEADNDENDENDITDDEEEDDYSSTHTSEIQNHSGEFSPEQTIVSTRDSIQFFRLAVIGQNIDFMIYFFRIDSLLNDKR